jgi:hypothetical protein
MISTFRIRLHLTAYEGVVSQNKMAGATAYNTCRVTSSILAVFFLFFSALQIIDRETFRVMVPALKI